MAKKENSGRIWLALSTTTEIAMAISLNRLSAVLPLWAVLLIWLVPFLLLITWAVREEKSKSFVRHLVETPFSYRLMAVVLLPLFVYTTRMVWVNVMSLASMQPAPVRSLSFPVSASPQPLEVAGPPPPSIRRDSPPHRERRANREQKPQPVQVTQIGHDNQQNNVGNVSCNGGGNCSGVNNGTQTTNYGVPQAPPNVVGLEISFTKPAILEQGQSYVAGPIDANPGSEASFRVSDDFPNATFWVKCDRPCVVTQGWSRQSGTASPSVRNTSNVSGIVELGMNAILRPESLVTVRVRSLDSSPVSILQVISRVPFSRNAK